MQHPTIQTTLGPLMPGYAVPPVLRPITLITAPLHAAPQPSLPKHSTSYTAHAVSPTAAIIFT